MPLNLRKVEPIGYQEQEAFVDGAYCGTTMVRSPVYPPSPSGELIRRLRMAKEIGLRDGAALLGIKASELSALERGELTLTVEGWGEAVRRIEGGN